MAFTYEVNEQFLYSGFTASISNSGDELEAFDPTANLLADGVSIPGLSLFTDIGAGGGEGLETAFPFITLTGLTNFSYANRILINTRSTGYTRLRQTGVLRDLPPLDQYGFLDVTKHFAQTVQRTAYNYSKSGEYQELVNSNSINDIVGPIDNLEDFFVNYKDYDFTTIFHRIETFSFIELDGTPDNILDNNVYEVLSKVSLNNLKINDSIMDAEFNMIDPPSSTTLEKQSKYIPYLVPNSIADIDSDSGVVFTVASTAFNYYYSSFPQQLANVKKKFKLAAANQPLFNKMLDQKNEFYSAFLEAYQDIEKGFRVRIQESPKFKMNKLSLYGTMDESAPPAEGSTGAPSMSSGTSTTGGGGYSY